MTKLKRARVSRRLSQLTVAMSTGLQPGLISQVENGRRQPNESDASKLAEFFGLTKDELQQRITISEAATK